MNAKIKKYVRERDEMLKKRDVAALEDFIKSHAEFYPEGFVEKIAALRDDLKQVMLHKMIVNAVKLPAEMRAESARWLVTRGFSLGV